jgi:hypothetical protein
MFVTELSGRQTLLLTSVFGMGSLTFWSGSGSGSADPYPVPLTNGDPDPTPFFCDFKDAKFFCHIFFV